MEIDNMLCTSAVFKIHSPLFPNQCKQILIVGHIWKLQSGGKLNFLGWLNDGISKLRAVPRGGESLLRE